MFLGVFVDDVARPKDVAWIADRDLEHPIWSSICMVILVEREAFARIAMKILAFLIHY